jgi:hypothetical protein
LREQAINTCSPAERRATRSQSNAPTTSTSTPAGGYAQRPGRIDVGAHDLLSDDDIRDVAVMLALYDRTN